jgi:hypothetical protein
LVTSITWWSYSSLPSNVLGGVNKCVGSRTRKGRLVRRENSAGPKANKTPFRIKNYSDNNVLFEKGLSFYFTKFSSLYYLFQQLECRFFHVHVFARALPNEATRINVFPSPVLKEILGQMLSRYLLTHNHLTTVVIRCVCDICCSSIITCRYAFTSLLCGPL